MIPVAPHRRSTGGPLGRRPPSPTVAGRGGDPGMGGSPGHSPGQVPRFAPKCRVGGGLPPYVLICRGILRRYGRRRAKVKGPKRPPPVPGGPARPPSPAGSGSPSSSTGGTPGVAAKGSTPAISPASWWRWVTRWRCSPANPGPSSTKASASRRFPARPLSGSRPVPGPPPPEFRDRYDALEFAVMCTAGFREPLTFCLRVRRLLAARRDDSTSSTTTSASDGACSGCSRTDGRC